jgi:hypothetical protein
MSEIRYDPDIVTVQREWEETVLRTPVFDHSPPQKIKDSSEFKSIQYKDEMFNANEMIGPCIR